MGRAPRPKPTRLPEKLRAIREALGLSQSQMWRRLGLAERISYGVIGGYETGRTEPPLPILLTYARSVDISTNMLIDDEIDLPDHLPNVPGIGCIHLQPPRKSG